MIFVSLPIKGRPGFSREVFKVESFYPQSFKLHLVLQRHVQESNEFEIQVCNLE